MLACRVFFFLDIEVANVLFSFCFFIPVEVITFKKKSGFEECRFL